MRKVTGYGAMEFEFPFPWYTGEGGVVGARLVVRLLFHLLHSLDGVASRIFQPQTPQSLNPSTPKALNL